MKRLVLFATAASLSGAAACTSARDNVHRGAPPATGLATAELRDASGRSVGTATAVQEMDGLRISIEGNSIPAGSHGAHLHAAGSCAAPDFTSAGPHWNPHGRHHGRENPEGAHLGDLPNVLIGTDGRGSLQFVIPGARLGQGADPLLDADGTSLVIHAAPDDHRTDPSGNSGARIACGVFRPA